MNLEDLSDDDKHFLRTDCTRMFINYTVPLYTYIDRTGPPEQIRNIGTGTLIRSQNQYGILTAHHVTHQITPALNVRYDSDHILMLIIIGRSEHISIPCKLTHEVEIGIPSSNEFGPDLTFLRIPPGPELSSLKATKSFWSLEENLNGLKAFKFKDTLLCTIGAPDTDQKIHQINPTEIEVTSGTYGYFGTYESSTIHKNNGFDFIDTPVDYNFNPSLPESFGGVSGGGLWAFRIEQNSQDKKKLIDLMFCGVAFYQSKTIGNKRCIRHHFGPELYKVIMDACNN